MEPKEDSIKMLEMRIRHQMNLSTDKNLKPENMQYYIPSSGMATPEEQQQAESAGTENLQQAASVGEDGTEGQMLYENPPADMDYIERAGEMAQMIESIELSETKEAQHARARNGYERVSRLLDDEMSFETKENHLLDAKG